MTGAFVRAVCQKRSSPIENVQPFHMRVDGARTTVARMDESVLSDRTGRRAHEAPRGSTEAAEVGASGIAAWAQDRNERAPGREHFDHLRVVIPGVSGDVPRA
jgi:hypothetical protein